MKRRAVKLIFPLIILLTFQGCGVWDNFTAYFNRYYNAKQSYMEAEEIILKENQNDYFAFKEQKIKGNANKPLDKVIEKCSKILQFHKESDFFDDALFMIGKAFYHKGQYSRALRKFKELARLYETEHRLENLLWMSRSELQMRNFDTGLSVLDSLKSMAVREDEPEILLEAYRTEVSYYLYKKEDSKAIKLINEMLAFSDDDEVTAQIRFELGRLYEEQEKYEEAAEQYLAAADASTDFGVDLSSNIAYASVLKRIGKGDLGLRILRDLKEEEKYKKSWGEIELEIGNNLYIQGKYEEAIEQLFLVDTAYSNEESAGQAKFLHAEIMEVVYADFDSAKFLYEGVTSSKAPNEIKARAAGRAQIITRRNDAYNNMSKFKRELSYVTDSTAFLRDSVIYANYIARKDSAQKVWDDKQKLNNDDDDKEKEQKPATRTTTRGRRGTQNQKAGFVYAEKPPFPEAPAIPALSRDTLIYRIVSNEYELANVYFDELEEPDSAFFYYKEILEVYPNTILHAKTLFALGSYYLSVDEDEKANGIFTDIYENYKGDPIVNAAAEKLGLEKIEISEDPANIEFLAAEAKMDSGKYEEALPVLREITKKYPESPLYPKALYTSGWILENKLEMPDSAVKFYDTLAAKFDKSSYTRDIDKRLKFFKRRKKEVQDSIIAVEKALRDSLHADSLATGLIVPETPATDSTVVSDSTKIANPAENLKPEAIKEEKADTSKGNRKDLR